MHFECEILRIHSQQVRIAYNWDFEHLEEHFSQDPGIDRFFGIKDLKHDFFSAGVRTGCFNFFVITSKKCRAELLELIKI
jgi:hypothetical protein